MTFFAPRDSRIASSNTRISNPRVAGSNPAAPTIYPQVSEVIDTSRPKPVVSVGFGGRLESNGDAIVGATCAHELSRSASGGDGASPAQAGRNSCALSAHHLHDQTPADLEKQQFANLVARAEAEPDKAEAWKLWQRVREFDFSFRFPPKGHSIWPPLVFASAAMVVFALAVAQHTRHVYFYSYPENYLRVVQNLDPCLPDGSCGYRFVMQAVTDGVAGQETEMHFCKGMQPRFEAGHSLSWIRYANLGSCQEIDGYDVVRNAGRLPVLPPNCNFDWPNNHIACKGGRANFEVNQKGANEHRPNTATYTGDSSETSTNTR